MMKFKYPTYYVIWDDAESDAAWTEEPQQPLKPTLAHTLGFLVRDEPGYILLADTYFLEGRTISNTTKIPRGMIVEMRQVNVSEKRVKKENIETIV